MSSATPQPAAPRTDDQSVASILAQCVVCGAVLVDDSKRIAAISDEARQLLGAEADRGDAGSLTCLPEVLAYPVDECLSSGKAIPERRIELQAPGQKKVAILVSASPVSSVGDKPGVLLVLKGMIAPERLEQEIRHLDRLSLIGTLSASIAHELRNALVAEKTFVDLLLEKNKDAELTDVVRRETARASALAGRMLKLAAVNRGAWKVLHLHEVLDHSLRLVQPELESRHIVLQKSFGASPDMVNGDDSGLEQVFVNLFLNAAEAMAKGGTLFLLTENCGKDAASARAAQGSQLRLSIRDTGTGIAPAELKQMFVPFFTTKPTGTGLGLVITQRIIQEHRGSISVESRQGEGTTFELRFLRAHG